MAQITVLVSYQKVRKGKQLSAATIYGESVATSIKMSLNANVSATQSLKNFYLDFGNLIVTDFDKICNGLMTENPEIGSLYLAPDAIISIAYPPEVFESTRSFEMLKDPEQAERALLAIETKKITVAGPHKLVEGGTGFIIRNPIFINDEFFAFTIAVLDWDAFVQKVLSQIDGENSGYRFGVWKKDAHAVTDEYGFIFKNSEADVSRLIDIPISIPNDIWHLSVEPVGGWKDISNMYAEIIFSSIIVLLLIYLVYLRQRTSAKNLYVARHDDLTGLLTRSEFLRKVEELLAEKPYYKFNVIAADIENFKVTNSMYGTEKCDEVLKYLADRFLELSTSKLCARYGSDHFIFMMPTNELNADLEYIKLLAEDISLKAPIDNLSVKYGFYGNVDKTTPVNIICDNALIAAKSINHKYEQVVANYEGPLSKMNIKAQILESSFLNAIKNEDFKIWYQPKFDAYTEEIVGAEALVRWIKPDGTIVSPTEFIHIFEEDGLIYLLDLYVFKKVCTEIRKWMEKGKRIIPISINISRNSLRHKNIIKEYEKIIKEIDIPVEYVPLEITESSTSISAEIKQLTEDLKSAGFKIHMDDFGTGVSSLESLNILPFDVIKLDKSLIDFIGTPVGEELLRHTIELIQFMNVRTIAEGVETKEQLDFLKKLKCDHIQGYLFSPPMPYDDFINFLEKSYARQGK